jgi:predicted GNAT family N-acyltransferase
MADSGYTFIVAKWPRDKDEIYAIRSLIFAEESRLADRFSDCDEDEGAYHLLVYDAGSRLVGTARMQPDGRVDYVAVLKPWRGNTVGGALLSYLRHIAQVTKLQDIWSDVPGSVTPFYFKNGFKVVGESSPEDDNSLVRVMRQVQPPELEDKPVH